MNKPKRRNRWNIVPLTDVRRVVTVVLVGFLGLGPVVAAGWLVATLTGALAGGATGGVIGALTQHAGLSKEDANLYAEGLRRGGAVVSVRVGDADAARYPVMDRSSVIKASDRADAYRKSGWTRYNPTARPYSADEVVKERSLYR